MEQRPPLTDRHGDPLPPGAIARLGTARLREGQPVVGLAFSPDGRWLASGGQYGSVHFWEAATGWRLADASPGRWGRSVNFVQQTAVSPDGRIRAEEGMWGCVRLCSTATGKVIRYLNGPGGDVTRLTFSPDGKMLAVISWRFRAVRGFDHRFTLWDVVTGNKLRQLLGTTQDNNTLMGDHCLVFSPDGQLMATTSWDGTVRLWSVASGKELHRFLESNGVRAVVFSRDGKMLAWACGGEIYLADVAHRQILSHWAVHRQAVLSLTFSPDNRVLASGGNEGRIHLWKVPASEEIPSPPGHQEIVRSVVYSSDGHMVASASDDGTVRLWEAATGKELLQLTGVGGEQLAFAPNSGVLAVLIEGSGRIRLWDVAAGGMEILPPKGKATRVWPPAVSLPGSLPPPDPVPSPPEWEMDGSCLAFSPDGTALATAGRRTSEDVIRVWEAAGGKWQQAGGIKVRTLTRTGKKVTRIAWSPGGKALASYGEDRMIRVWDVATGKERRQLRQSDLNDVTGLAFSPDGKLLAAVNYEGLRMWETSSGRERCWLKRYGLVHKFVAFSPDGRILAAGSRNATVRLLEVASGKECGRLTGHLGEVPTVAFSPDGKTIASGSADSTVLIWDLARVTDVHQP